MNEIRVLHVLDQININSGVSSVVMNYFNIIDNKKVIFDFMVHTQIEQELKIKIEEQGSQIYIMPELCLKNILSYTHALNIFFQQHHEYSIIHGHIPNASFFYLRAAKRADVKVRILHSHSSRGSKKLVKRIRNFLLSKMGVTYATCYFACSKSAGRYLFGRKNVEKDNVYYLHNAIDIKKFKYNEHIRLDIRKQWEIEDKFVIGHVGRFSSEKNHKLMVNIFKEVLKKNPNSVLLLIGSGELEEEIIEKVNEEVLNDKIIFTGAQPNINDFMQAMDVFILPSLFEGLPVVCIEAQASNLPCIISDKVTRETKINDSVQFENNDNINNWVNAILNSREIIRNCNQIKLKASRYNITEEAKCLVSKYMLEDKNAR